MKLIRSAAIAAVSLVLALPASAGTAERTERPSGSEVLAASALLAIDRHRPTIVERIVSEWGEKLAASGAGIGREQLKELLLAMRADQLLAASLAGSLDGLKSVVMAAAVTKQTAAAKVIEATDGPNALGDPNADLVYTPVTPCRLFDTRVSQGGLGTPTVGVRRTYGAITPVASQGGPGGCAAASGAAVALIQIGTLTPSGNGLLQGGPQGAASFPNALILYQPGDQYGTAVAMPLNPANGRFDLVEQFATADLYGDLLGYFKPPAGGFVTSVATGAGLTGGPITAAGTVNLATTQLLPTTACTSGQVVKWNGGAWACAQDNTAAGGGVTSLSQGAGITLTPNPVTASGTVAADTGYLQRRVSSSCPAGSSIRAIAADGTVTCETDDVGTGTVTSITAGSGLTGGTITGSGTIAVDPASSTLTGSFFRRGGNAFGAVATLGTTDSNAVEVVVNCARVVRYEPNATSPNLLGGYAGNRTTATTNFGATIAGGGKAGSDCWDPIARTPTHVCRNDAGDMAAIGGGQANVAGSLATVGGGYSNAAGAQYGVVGGGGGNIVSGDAGTVGGGQANTAGKFATIGGGEENNASEWATVGGGGLQHCQCGICNSQRRLREYRAAAVGATVGGGGTWFSGTYTYGPNIAAGGASTVAGGFANRIDAGGTFGIIGGGSMNRITAAAGVDIKFATVGGGTNNTVGRGGATVAGGNSNQATGFDASVGGGNGNVASGGAATVPGGGANTAQGKYSFAAGRRTKAVADGAVLFSDSTDADFTGTFPNVFAVGFTGGIGMWTSKTFATGCSIPAGGGAWSCTSSRDQKQDFAAVDAQDVLQRVAALPITEWRYRTEASGARHMGPTAQDFHTAFELGDSETSIGLIDAAGIALAAIQGVNAKLEEQLAVKGAEIDSLKAEVAELKRAVEVLLTRTSPEGRVTERR